MLHKKIGSIFSSSLAIVALTSGTLIVPIESFASEGQKLAQGGGAGYVLGVASTAGTVIDIAIHCYQGGQYGWQFNHAPNTSPKVKAWTEQIADRGFLNSVAYQTCLYGTQGVYSVCKQLGLCKSLKSYEVARCRPCPQIVYIQRTY
ncbi:hypothetical protein H6G76_11995 [Nostoc sp. FACHB-152]|uniref:hypothetical protein n=1 Tax=unclassified Nostoc TaxID=2593658 RepID=UPI001683EA18|nr:MULTISPECIES: hypothetical protein [unclassified Nostoc]MBD2447886.1 hypothetical protein [Nostoc sp. FACHB-152]MBD2468540.1 hypothetical protein [Nostoc sp. FACHB-145]